MKDFICGFILAMIIFAVAWGLLVVEYERRYRAVEVEAYHACEDAHKRAQEFGRERNKLWIEIARLKRLL